MQGTEERVVTRFTQARPSSWLSSPPEHSAQETCVIQSWIASGGPGMKRALALLVGGVLVAGSALAAHAQAPTVGFGGQMRVYGFVFDNITDLKDSEGGAAATATASTSSGHVCSRTSRARQEGQGGLGRRVRGHHVGRRGRASAPSRGCPGRQLGPLPLWRSPAAGSARHAADHGDGFSTGHRRQQPGRHGWGGCLGNNGVDVETSLVPLVRRRRHRCRGRPSRSVCRASSLWPGRSAGTRRATARRSSST